MIAAMRGLRQRLHYLLLSRAVRRERRKLLHEEMPVGFGSMPAERSVLRATCMPLRVASGPVHVILEKKRRKKKKESACVIETTRYIALRVRPYGSILQALGNVLRTTRKGCSYSRRRGRQRQVGQQ